MRPQHSVQARNTEDTKPGPAPNCTTRRQLKAAGGSVLLNSTAVISKAAATPPSLDNVQGAELPESAVAPSCILQVLLEVSQHQVVP